MHDFGRSRFGTNRARVGLCNRVSLRSERQSAMRQITQSDHGPAMSKAALVLRRLRADIVSGAFEPDQKLSFKLLVAAYGVGTSPLREALCQLVGQGLVVLESQKGFHVAPVSTEDLADVVRMRRHAEIHALALSMEHADIDWRGRLRAATDMFSTVAAKAGDQRPIDERWEAIHRCFHFALIGACGSPILLQFCKQIYHRFDRYRRIAIPVQSMMAGPARDHHEITAAALSGDSQRAQVLLGRHIDDITEVILTYFPAQKSLRPPHPLARRNKRKKLTLA